MGVSAYFDSSQVTLINGGNYLKNYEYPTESGGHFQLRFCTNCGSALFWKSEARPGLTGGGGGTFDPPTFWYKIEREISYRSKAEFVNTDVKAKSQLGPIYQTVNDERQRLKGG